MSTAILVTDAGFAPAGPAEDWLSPGDLDGPARPDPVRVALTPETDPDLLGPHLARIAAIRVVFPAVADGRGFTLARRLRRMGFAGQLRAAGQLIPEQYPMARACGFDEVEIDADRALRQPEADWRRAAGRQGYLARLRRAVA
ncbi:oxidoreductase probably involved in sulfite reduction [Rhodovulum sulfidophilum]|uniref:Oxidoreductase probably involved in sulfite reduction n=1 Tax=Rhodovulum sulfidophilum TaxID=35806 RepID=A0A0D6B4C0_RHOSU|nr:oxidoreductase probably involved in sulfite reduction [Rhodovulum sulfidophilum]